MRKFSILILMFLLATGSFAASSGWVSLFNGKNLNGWKVVNGKADYKIVKGVIVGTSVVGSPNSFLATTVNYGDFILEYDMKMDRGLNSGVQIRSISDPAIKEGRVHGYQIECDDSERGWSAGIYDEARRGWLYPLEYNQTSKKAYKKGEWNSYRVECIGNSIRTWLNGVPCANLVDDMTAMGIIALQVHSIGERKEDAGKTVCWRNIRIKTTDLAAEQKKMDDSVPEVSYLTNTLTKAEQKAGWQLLWDGKTLNGWVSNKDGVVPQKGWVIQDNDLIVDLGANKGGGDLVTQKEFKNFILEIDFKLTPGANSGIKYFVQPNANGKGYSNVACEYQVLDDERHPDAKAGINGNRTLASLYDLITANSQKFDPAQAVKRSNAIGQWNRARIEVRGEKVTHYLNGIKIVEYTRGTPEWRALVATSKFKGVKGYGEYATGHLLLQEHGNEVHYRNIKVKEL
jgi:hypothetical protein